MKALLEVLLKTANFPRVRRTWLDEMPLQHFPEVCLFVYVLKRTPLKRSKVQSFVTEDDSLFDSFSNPMGSHYGRSILTEIAFYSVLQKNHPSAVEDCSRGGCPLYCDRSFFSRHFNDFHCREDDVTFLIVARDLHLFFFSCVARVVSRGVRCGPQSGSRHQSYLSPG